MSNTLLSLVSFVLISTFTPGPNNISSASMAVLYGYKKTLNYMAGMAAGVFLVMLFSGWISTSLLTFFPTVEPIVRWVGAAYILYLAFAILKASYTFDEDETKPMGFSKGFMLQFLNPKLMVYALTLFSAFLTPIIDNAGLLLLAVMVVTTIAFCATSSWALFGTAIQTYLHQPRVKVVVNSIFSLFLIYTALTLAGII